MSEEEKQKKKKVLSKKGRIILNTILVVALLVAVFSGYQLISGLMSYKEADDKYSTFKTASRSTADPAASQSTVTDTVDWSYLRGINEDIAGWINLPDSVIDYPVVYADDNEYYLKHLLDGTYNIAGCVFVDARNSRGFTDKNTVLYGHNMNDVEGSMFSNLNKYASQDFYESHKVITLDTPTALYNIQVVAGIKTTGTGGYISLTFADTAEFQAYVKRFVDNSTFQSDVTVADNDQIMVLSTCTPSGHDTRYALLGKLVKVKTY